MLDEDDGKNGLVLEGWPNRPASTALGGRDRAKIEVLEIDDIKDVVDDEAFAPAFAAACRSCSRLSLDSICRHFIRRFWNHTLTYIMIKWNNVSLLLSEKKIFIAIRSASQTTLCKSYRQNEIRWILQLLMREFLKNAFLQHCVVHCFLVLSSIQIQWKKIPFFRVIVIDVELPFISGLGTWASVRPREAASWRRSGLVMYFCIWNRFSRPFLWRCENTALVQDFFRFPVPEISHIIVIFFCQKEINFFREMYKKNLIHALWFIVQCRKTTFIKRNISWKQYVHHWFHGIFAKKKKPCESRFCIFKTVPCTFDKAGVEITKYLFSYFLTKIAWNQLTETIVLFSRNSLFR